MVRSVTSVWWRQGFGEIVRELLMGDMVKISSTVSGLVDGINDKDCRWMILWNSK